VMFSVHFVRLRQTSSDFIPWYPMISYDILNRSIESISFYIHLHGQNKPVNRWCVDVRSWRGRPWRSRVKTRAAAVSRRSHRFSHSSAPGAVTVWGHGESRNLWCSFHINIFTLKASETDNWSQTPGDVRQLLEGQ
jgi:hypothetical protein